MTKVPVVTLHLWGVPTAHVPAAVLRMALDRRPLRRARGLQFAKHLGTGTGHTFTVRDADVHHWGLLACWDTLADARAVESAPVGQAWERLAHERLRVVLRPLASRGAWSGRQPFGDPAPSRHEGPVAAITRARIAPRHLVRFWRAVPPVSADLRLVPGLRLAVGIGEAPVGLQGTFSLWDSPDPLVEFAHRRAAHADVVRRTTEIGWYAEELFARFAVLDLAGRFAGRGY